MFRKRRNFNDIFGDFESMFGQFESLFGGMPSGSSSESGTDEIGDWTKETYTSPDGKIFITNFVRNSGSHNPTKNSGITSLKRKLQIAIEEENFEKSIEIRDQLKKLKS